MLQLKRISKTYSTKGGVTHQALDNVSLSFEEKGLVFILGKSGSGKSTLLNIIGGLDQCERGEMLLYNRNVHEFNSLQYDFYRNTFVGFIFQEFNLIDNLNMYDNVKLALDLQTKRNYQAVDAALQELGIADLKYRKSYELSGGQRQRVAIARAIAKNPSIILADEPSGSLDTKTTSEIFDVLKKLSKRCLVIVVSHNRDIATEYGDRIIEIKDGQILKDLSLKAKVEEENNRSSMIGESILVIPQNKEVQADDINKLNTIISHQRKDYFLAIESDARKVKALYPHFREAVDSATKNKEQKEIIKYAQYHYPDEEQPKAEVKFIRSWLPIKKGIRFGLSNLKTKKAKLTFTIILAMLGIILSGIGDHFAHYDYYKGISMTAKKDKININLSSKNVNEFNQPYTLTEYEQSKIKKIVNSKYLSFYYDKELAVDGFNINPEIMQKKPNYVNDYGNVLFDGIFCGFLETKSPQDFNYKYHLKSHVKYNLGESVTISTIAANILSKFYNKSSMENLLDSKIMIDGIDYYVEGIFDANDRRYDLLLGYNPMAHELAAEYNTEFNKIIGRVIIPIGGIEKARVRKNIENFSFSLTNDYHESVLTNETIMRKDNNFSSLTIEKELLLPASKGLYIGKDLLATIYLAEMETYTIPELLLILNNGPSKMLIQKSYIIYLQENVKIKGIIIEGPKEYLNSVIIEDDLFNDLQKQLYLPNSFNLNTNQLNTIQTTNYLKKMDKQGFKIRSNFIEIYDSLDIATSFFSSLLNGLSNFIFIIVIILLFTFINYSITDNTKKIGILRALGANTFDIFKIFILEGLIIGFISLGLALGLINIGGIIANTFASVNSANYFAIYTFSFAPIVKMISVTLTVVVISLIIPTIRLIKMRPVDSISEKNSN